MSVRCVELKSGKAIEMESFLDLGREQGIIGDGEPAECV